MPSFWNKVVRTIDRLLGDPQPGYGDVDPEVVDEAIRLIQTHVDADRESRSARRLRVSELSPERRAQLAEELTKLLKKPEPAAEATDVGEAADVDAPAHDVEAKADDVEPRAPETD